MPDFDADAPPAIVIEPGEKLLTEAGLSAKPATGPVSILGAEPGDSLVVTIHDVKIEEAFWWWSPGTEAPSRQGIYGELGRYLEGMPRTVHPRLGEQVLLTIPISDGMLIFSDRVQVPLRPVVGTIGVAPAGKPQPTNLAGHYGGNYDCREIKPGARVHFPVAAPGAGLGLCDLHGAQPDGELLPGVECTGEVILSAEITKNSDLPMTFVESETHIHCIGCGATIQKATDDALAGMLGLIRKRLGLSMLEAAQLVGTQADIRVCQMVNHVINMRVSIPKEAVPHLELAQVR
jgi:amidase